MKKTPPIPFFCSLFFAFVSIASGQRVATDLQALYDFEEGSGTTITDVSGVAGDGNPLNLGVENASYSWGGTSPNGYFETTAENRATNATDSNKIFDAATANDAITVEAWITPTEANTGPGRIVTMSLDPFDRNFTLGQNGGAFQVRLRTTTNGDNGTNTTLDGGAATVGALIHVVFTRDAAGNAALYVTPSTDINISQVDTATIAGDFSNWVSSYDFGIGNELTTADNDPVRNFNGEYHLAAVYSRALSSAEVQQNFDEGPVAITPGVISGVVQDSNGAGLSGVTVTAFDGPTQAAQDTTIGDGTYSLTGLTDTTTYDIVFVPPGGYLPTQSEATATSPTGGVNATFTAHAEVGCNDNTSFQFDWGSIGWVDPPNDSSYPWVQTFTDVSGSGIDVTVTIPRKHRSGNSDYIDGTLTEDIDVYAGDVDVLRFWHPNDTQIDQLLVSFSAPVAAGNMVFGGNRLNGGAYGTLEFKAFDGANGTGNVVLPNASVHPDPSTIDSVVRGVAVADPAGGAFTVTDFAGTTGADLNAAYIPAREGYVHVGLSGSRNWGIIDYQDVAVRSFSWELYNSTVNDPATARDNLTSGTGNSAYFGGFQFAPASGGALCDFGDLPDSGAGAYETLAANDGARHVVDGVTFLGAAVDIEADGQPTSGADGDDVNGSPDDEDGVTIPTMTAGSTAVVTVVAGSPGALSAFVDFDGDGTLDPVTLLSSTGPAAVATGVIGDTLLTAAGTYQLTVQVPASAVEGNSFARFRFTANAYEGGNSTSGPALTGEVEDYPLAVRIPVGAIAGTTYEDTDGDGDADTAIDVTTIRLFDADGTTPADNPNNPGNNYVITTTDGTYEFTNLPPGSYVVKQDQPTGYLTVTDGDTSNPGDDTPPNGSGADNEIPVTVVDGELDDGNDFVEVLPLAIGDLVFTDDNNNGIFEPGLGEVGIDGVEVKLYEKQGLNFVEVATDVTNNGDYEFTGLYAGEYQVVVTQVNFDSGGALEFKSMSSTADVTDTNDNGQQDDDNGIQATPGTSTVSPTITLALNDEPGTGGGTNDDHSIDFGFLEPVGVGNLVFIDTNGDGFYTDGVDTPASDVTVEIYNAGAGPGVGSAIASVDTDLAGNYQFTNLLPGDYIVHIPAAEFLSGAELEGYTSVTGSTSGYELGGIAQVLDDNEQFQDDGIDSPAPSATGISSASFSLTLGGESTTETGEGGGTDIPDANIDFTVDFGFKAEPAAGIGNLVFIDANRDGDFDSATEVGVDDVIVALLDGVGTPIAVDITRNGGFYYFGGLADGDYQVAVLNSNFEAGKPLEGYESSAGYGLDGGGDDNVDENGIDVPDPATNPVLSSTISIAVGMEVPTLETGEDAAFDNLAENDNDLTVDFGFVIAGVGIGNFVFVDNDGSGNFNPGGSGDTTVPGVKVELYNAGDVPGVDSPLATVETNIAGVYSFTGLLPGGYVVHIPASEFGVGEPLEGLVSVAGNGGDNAADDNSDENGIDSAGPTLSGISSGEIALAVGAEPTESGIFGTLDDTVESNYDLTVDFGFEAPTGAGIGNLVFIDTDGDGVFETADGDAGVPGVIVELYTAAAPPGTGSAVRTTVTAPDGSYYFGGLADGDYIVHIPASEFAASAPLEDRVSSAGNGGDDGVDDDAGENGIDSGSPTVSGVSSGVVALASGTEGTESGAGGAGDNGAEADNDLSVDMGFATATGTVGIGNLVFRDGNQDGDFDPATETGIDGVTVELYLASAPPGSGSPVATTETHSGGCYLFTGLAPDSYIVHIPSAEFGPGGDLQYQSVSAAAGSDTTTDDNADQNGVVDAGGVSSNTFALAVGNEPVEAGKDGTSDDASETDINLTADFGFTGKARSYTEFQNDHAALFKLDDVDPGNDVGDPADNPDGDLYNNAVDYALCDPPGSGVNPKPFCVDQLSGTVDASFTRIHPAPGDVTYTLEVAPGLGSPPAWTDSATVPAVSDNLDGSATVTFPDLESELASGIARLKIEITGDLTGPHYTPTFGWSTLSADAECETCSNPYAPKGVFSGTIDDGSTATLDLSTSAGGGDIGAQMTDPDRPYYIEIISGACEGHRIDVASATTTGITLDTTSARNTLSPIPDLTGEQIVLRPHNVLDDVVTAQDFVDTVTPGNNDNPATAGRVLLFDNTNGWSTYFAYNDSGAIVPAFWSTADNSGLENVGNAELSGDPDDLIVVIEPCAGFYVHSKAQSVDVLMVGVVREWDFACPLSVGYNLVGSGYPQDQSPNDRGMSETYFSGTSDPFTADQIEFWLSDGAVLGIEAYDSHFRLDDGASGYWTTQENSSLAPEDAIEMFKIQRASFINSRAGHAKTKAGAWTWPVPWDADAP